MNQADRSTRMALLARLATVVDDAGSAPVGPARIARAPGRVNLIGEHTDYNDGFVLPVAIDLETWIAFQPTADRRVELTLAATGERDGFDLDAIGARRGTWIDYVAGVALELAAAGRAGARAPRGRRGRRCRCRPGFRRRPRSSSRRHGRCSPPAIRTARARLPTRWPSPASRSAPRTSYVGVACGLMDQFASASGRRGEALLLDCRSLEWRGVPLPLEDHALVVCHSGSERRLEASAYNERRRQCEAAVAALQAAASRGPIAARRRSRHARGRGETRSTRRRAPRPARHRGERARAGHRRGPGAGDLAAVGRAVGPRATRPSATCTRSARRSSTPWSRSPSASTASWPPG